MLIAAPATAAVRRRIAAPAALAWSGIIVAVGIAVIRRSRTGRGIAIHPVAIVIIVVPTTVAGWPGVICIVAPPVGRCRTSRTGIGIATAPTVWIVGPGRIVETGCIAPGCPPTAWVISPIAVRVGSGYVVIIDVNWIAEITTATAVVIIVKGRIERTVATTEAAISIRAIKGVIAKRRIPE